MKDGLGFRGTFLGIPMIRIMAYWGQFVGPAFFGQSTTQSQTKNKALEKGPHAWA